MRRTVAVEVGPQFTAGDAAFEDPLGGGATQCLCAFVDLGGELGVV